MAKWYTFLLLFSLFYASKAQETTLPVDLRQHNLTEYNSSLFNPVFSLDRNRPQSIAFWSRWQWQGIDGDPTTLFLNYSRAVNSKSAIGIGFFQNNTETFLKTGGALNYAYSFNLGTNTSLAVGINVFGYQQEFTNPNPQPDPPLPIPQLEVNNSFILQFAPGIRLTSNGFGIGIASENLFDYNFKNKEAETLSSEKIYMGMMSYDVPLALGSSLQNAFLQPNVYLKTIPNEDTQFGLNMLLSTSKFWAQTGYNSFYGIGVGGGGRFFQNLSLGALIEFGTSSAMKDNDSSIELIAAYGFGRQTIKEPTILEEDTEKPLLEKDAEKSKNEKIKERLARTEAIAAEKEAKRVATMEAKQRKVFLKDSLDRVNQQERLAGTEKLKEQLRLDSINKTRAMEAIAAQRKLQEEKRLDSLRNVQLAAEEAIKKAAEEKLAVDNKLPKTQGRYEEVQQQEGVAPGYYLIANVFGTKKYFDSFMTTLRNKGLTPKSFYRAVNKYNYVYLERYDSLREAEIARDNQFGGKYPDKTWIFRVIEE